MMSSLTSGRLFLTALVFLAATFSFAQPGDVNRIDIRLVDGGPGVLEVQLRPNNAWDYTDGVLNMTFAIRWQTSEGGTINSDLIDQYYLGGPPFCFLQGAPLAGTTGVGIDNVDANGFRYKGLNVNGNQIPSSCSFAANTWTSYARVPYSGVTGCTTFEIVLSDTYSEANNTSWFISLGGVSITGNSLVVGPGVEAGTCAGDCNGVVGGTAFIDNCNTCVGGNTGLTACVADCNGVFGGTAVLEK